MTVTYEDPSVGALWQIDIFGYEASVAWNNGHAILPSGIQSVSLDAGPRVAKHDPHPSWSAVSTAVLAGFRACAASTSTPLPTPCTGIGDQGYDAKWTLDSNPLANALENFDPSTGIVHVTGSYAMSESYKLDIWNTRETDSFPGNYNAFLILDGTRVTLLQITEQG